MTAVTGSRGEAFGGVQGRHVEDMLRMGPWPSADLMSFHGTLLCAAEGGAIRQRPFLEAGARPADLELAPIAGSALVGVTRGGTFLRADPNGRDTAYDRDSLRDHETFLPIEAADRAVIGGLLRHDFLWRSTAQPAGPARLRAPFTLELGDVALDLRQQVPFLGRALPHRIDALRDGWRLDELCLFRPLVVFTVFGKPEIVAQFGLAMRSLATRGAYGGDVMVITDRPRGDIMAACSGIEQARVQVVQLAPADRVGFIAARYVIADIHGIHRYQPILYADTDTIFDAPVTPMLRKVAVHDRIAAPIEPHAPLATSMSSGADLLDKEDVQSALGFNAGTMGIPNAVEHAATLRLVRRLVVNRADVLGRSKPWWVDQPVANYAHWRRGGFDTFLLSPYVRWGNERVSAGARDRIGLVHFWPPRKASEKVSTMRRYLEAIDG